MADRATQKCVNVYVVPKSNMNLDGMVSTLLGVAIADWKYSVFGWHAKTEYVTAVNEVPIRADVQNTYEPKKRRDCA